MKNFSQFTKKVALKTHKYWSRLFPSKYIPYRSFSGRIYLDIKESEMMFARIIGEYEKNKFAAIRQFLKPGGTFIDVGANKGDFALFASNIVRSNGSVLAFEPEPFNVHWLRKSIEINVYRNIQLFEVALSDKNGSAELFIGEKSGWHSLLGEKGSTHRKLDVTVRTLDSILDEINFNRPINVMKIDVEGAEQKVLKGANKLLGQQNIVLLIDLHPHHGVNVQEVVNTLEVYGFSVYDESPPFKKLFEPKFHKRDLSVIAYK
jgi:FkbM family methyltransferase